jgi:hypothetical protein
LNDIIGVPLGTRLIRIERDTDNHCWLVWTARSPDGTCGSYIVLHDDGLVVTVCARADEGDESFVVKPRDR